MANRDVEMCGRLRRPNCAWPTTRDFLSCRDAHRNALEKSFFRSIILPNKTFKTTCAGRLDDVNEFVAPILASIKSCPLKIMDVAVSSGISTMEWAEDLSKRNIIFQMTGTDKLIDAELISVFSGFEVLATHDGQILHMDVAGYGISAAKELRTKAYLLPLKVALKLLFRVLNSPRLAREPVRLLSQQMTQEVSFEEDDLLIPNPHYAGCFDVIRAANILNRAYFSPSVLTELVRTLKGRLKDGGLLIVCRTRGTTNEATAFGTTENRTLEVLGRLRQGSEIEEIVLSA